MKKTAQRNQPQKDRQVNSLNGFTLSAADTLQQAAHLLYRNSTAVIVVFDRQSKPLGVVGNDELLQTIAEGLSPSTPLEQIACRQFTITEANAAPDFLENNSSKYCLLFDREQFTGQILCPTTTSTLFNPDVFFSDLSPILDTIHMPIVVIDNDCKVVSLNRSASQAMGQPASAILGQAVTSVLEPSAPRTLIKNNDVKLIQKFQLGDRCYITNWAPVKLSGNMIGAMAVLHDSIAYETMSDELLKAQNVSRELNAIIDSSFDGIFVTDAQSRALRVNKAYERITGIKEGEVVGKTMVNLLDEGVYDESVTLKVLKKKHPVTIVQNIIKNGKTIVVTGNPVFDDNGNIVRVVTNVRDVTELNRLQEKLKKMEQLQSRYQDELQRLQSATEDHQKFVIKSKKMIEIYELALKLAKVDSTILIQGDSGVGKEVFCEIVHRNGTRQDKPFVKISCATIPENLLESELFGYAPGTFTGAAKEGRAGLFEFAHGGTIFLDEIGEMPIGLQAKLLRVLQEREFVRLGGTKSIKVDTRIMAATNRDLEEMVKSNLFRKDLFFRLNVVPVLIPPLRERQEAISHFIFFFLQKHNKKYGFSRQITPEAVDKMVDYDWPGNVREVENLIERLVVMGRGEVISVEDLPSRIINKNAVTPAIPAVIQPLKIALEDYERRLLSTALEKHGSSRKAAAALGIDQSTVVRKAGRLGIALTNT